VAVTNIPGIIPVPRFHEMAPYNPEEKGAQGLLQLLTILGNKEQDVLGAILKQVEELHTALVTQQLDMASFMPTLVKLVRDPRISSKHRQHVHLLLQTLFPE
jgi:hypothetical protein